jgi:hypothetical protein
MIARRRPARASAIMRSNTGRAGGGLAPFIDDRLETASLCELKQLTALVLDGLLVGRHANVESGRGTSRS